jgi:hypothetical protein
MNDVNDICVNLLQWSYLCSLLRSGASRVQYMDTKSKRRTAMYMYKGSGNDKDTVVVIYMYEPLFI